MNPGNSENKRLLLDPCHLTFRSIVYSVVCLYLVCLKKFTEKAAFSKSIDFQNHREHSSFKRGVMS